MAVRDHAFAMFSRLLTSVMRSLNAPIPAGAAFGYHPGGWGKPPVDEFGRPIYGDVFGVTEIYHEVCVFRVEKQSRELHT
jgi:hypothetical protein